MGKKSKFGQGLVESHTSYCELSIHTAIVSEAKDDPELVAALSETMYYNMRERLQGDTDYDPERFPNAQNFYHPRK